MFESKATSTATPLPSPVFLDGTLQEGRLCPFEDNGSAWRAEKQVGCAFLSLSEKTVYAIVFLI
jgi:hypothetical protein